MRASSSPPKVAHLVRLDAWAGTQQQVATLVLFSDPAVTQQRILIMGAPGELHSWLETKGADVLSLAGRFGFVGVVLRLVRTLRQRRVDAIEAYGFRAAALARLIKLAVGRPSIIVGVRGLHLSEAVDAGSLKARFGLATERVLTRMVSCYDANSWGARDYLISRGLPADKFVVIPNGVELYSCPWTHARSKGPVRAVCVARFIPRKRHDVLLHALARVRDSGIDMHCSLIGHGPLAEEIWALTTCLNLTDRVAVLGSVSHSEVGSKLAEADIFVLTSMWEGMPGSVLEAMAAGLPVVATDVNGTSEVVQDRVTGFLVPADDAVATAEALISLARDKNLRHRMGAAGRERIRQHFTVDRMVSAKEALYKQLAR